MTLFLNTRRPRIVSPHAALLAVITLTTVSRLSAAQEQVPIVAPKSDIPPAAQTKTPSPSDVVSPNSAPPAVPQLAPTLDAAGIWSQNPVTGDIRFSGRTSISYMGIVIAADRIEGNPNTELVFSGNARIAAGGTITYADTIHFYPTARRYRLENARSVLTPSVMQNRITENVFVTARDVLGTRTGYTLGEHTVETTCIEPFHHYELRSRDAQLIPGKRLVLHQTSMFLFGVKLITIPYIVIPLDDPDRHITRRPRPSYFPEFGQNASEGYYARFPYEFPIGEDAATYVQVSATQKLGERLRVEQEYIAGKQTNPFNTSGANFGGGYSGGGGYGGGLGGSDAGGSFNSAYGYGNIGPRLPRLGVGLGPSSGGLFTIQGYTASGFDRNFTSSFRHQQGIGGGNRFGFSAELEKQSYLVSSGQTTVNSRFDFAHDDTVHGVNGLASLSLQKTDSGAYSTDQLTGSLRDAYTFASQGTNRNSLMFQADLSHLISSQTTAATSTTPASSSAQRTARIDTQFQFQHTSREYDYIFSANKDTPFGPQSSNSTFGSLEKLPEFQLNINTLNFKGGDLRLIPATLLLNLGRYNEPSNKINTERLLFNANIPQITILRGRTEIITSGGFEQRLYGDGAAEYITRDNTRLRQHLGGRSGLDFNYTYEQPAGGTPFAFDAFNRSHYITAEGGYLDDKKFQATFRTGYDLTGRTVGRPWQTLAGRLMWQPQPSIRVDSLSTYDPNTGKFVAITNQLRLRGPHDFAFDLVSRIDPNQLGIRRKFSQINTQFDVPFAHGWRVSGLLRFNGGTGLFESRAAELIHEWDCLEASFTYSENPNSFNSDRQFYFALRIKGLPSTRRFYRGPAGEAQGIGVGDIY